MTSDSKANVKHDVRNNERKKEKEKKHTKYSQNKTTQEQEHSLKEMNVKNKIAYTTQNGKSKNIM